MSITFLQDRQTAILVIAFCSRHLTDKNSTRWGIDNATIATHSAIRRNKRIVVLRF